MINRNYFAVLAIMIIVGSMVLAIVAPVLAISDPDSITIERVKVFEGIWEPGDWLVVCEYDIAYSGTDPAENPNDTFLFALYDGPVAAGTATMVASNPLNYYDHNLISIYLTASQVVTKNLDWDDLDNYSVRLSGNPSYFDPLIEGVNMLTRDIAPVDLFAYDTAYNREQLGGVCIIIAESLESDWPVDLIGDNGRLNEVGSLIFRKAIPGLDQVVPNIFEVSLSAAEAPKITKVLYLYPNGDDTIGISGINPGTPTNHYSKVNWPVENPGLYGDVTGTSSATSIVSSDFTQDDGYWASATMLVYETPTGGAPQGESQIITDWDRSSRTFTTIAFSGTIPLGSTIVLDKSDTYIYTTSTTLESDLYDIGTYDFTASSEIKHVTVHFTLVSSGSGNVFCRPYIELTDQQQVGDWRMTAFEDNPIHIGKELINPVRRSWQKIDIPDLKVGIDIYSSSPSNEARVSRVFVEVVYTTSDMTGDYAAGLRSNMGNRLTNATEGFGEWIGVPGTIVAGIGALIIYLVLAGRVYVATGSTQAAIVLTIPFLLIGAVLGLIPLYIIFAFGFVIIVLFGITFILARLA